jgi:hypothetical protein
MHVMLKRAAASAIPALLGLAISPATAMAAPQSGPVIGGSAHGVIIHGKDAILGNDVYALGSVGIDNRRGLTVGNGIVGTAGNSVKGRVAAVTRP